MSRGTYTISAVSEHTVDDGDFRIYYVRLQEAQPKEGVQAFEVHQKRATGAPKQGQTLEVKAFQEGTRDGKPYVKIIKDWDAIKAKQASGGGQSSGGDERGESIERQVAAKVAGEMAIGTPDPSGLGAVLVISNFEAYFDAVLRKIKGGSAQSVNGGGEVPADTDGLQPAATAADESIPF